MDRRFFQARVKLGLLQLQSIAKSSSRPTRGQTQTLKSWDTPAELCLPGPAGENPSLCILTAPAWAQPGCPCSSLCKASHLHLQPQPLLLRPCPGAQLLHGGSSSGHWLAQGAKGLFYLLWSLGSAAKQGFLEHSAPSDLAAMLGHCPAPPQPGGEVTSLSIRMSLGDALLPTRMELTSGHGPGDIPAAFAAPACPGGTASCHPLPRGHVCIPAPLI